MQMSKGSSKNATGAIGGSTYAFDFGLGVGSQQSSNVPLAQQKMRGLGQRPSTSAVGGFSASRDGGVSEKSPAISHLPNFSAQTGASNSGPTATARSGHVNAGPASTDFGVFTGWTGSSPGNAIGGVAGVGAGMSSSVPGSIGIKSSSASEDPFASLMGGVGKSGSLASLNVIRKSVNDASPSGIGSMDAALPHNPPLAHQSVPLGSIPFPSMSAAVAFNAPIKSHVDRPSPLDDPFSFLGQSHVASPVSAPPPFSDDGFASFQSAPAVAPPSVTNAHANPTLSHTFNVTSDTLGGGASNDDWGAFFPSKSAKSVDGFDALFGTPIQKPTESFVGKGGGDDWGVSWDNGETAGGRAGGTSKEAPNSGSPLEVSTEDGPPVPPGVNWRMARQKGEEYYKGGQFGEALEWLRWARQLAAASGSKECLVEILIMRASAFKEAGEYKKAVADCTLAFELDSGNTSILVQRGVLYEAMEKYKLGAADLKEVVKREPSNRNAVNLLTRLNKAAVANG